MNRIIILIFALLTLFSHSQETKKTKNLSELNIHEIMKGNDFIGHQPSNIEWDQNGEYIFFKWNTKNEPISCEYTYNLKNKEIKKTNTDFYEKISKYHRTSYYSESGDLIYYNKNLKEKIISINESIDNVQEHNDVIYFQIKNGIYKYNKITRSIKQIVEFIKGNDTKKINSNKNIDYMELQEIELFDFHKHEKEKKEWIKNRQNKKQQKSIYYPKGSISNIQVGYDGNFILFRIDEYPELKKTSIEHHISIDGHTYTNEARPKVSDKDPKHKLGIYNKSLDTVYYVDFSSLKNIRKKPEYLKYYINYKHEKYKKNRNIIMHKAVFSNDGKKNIMDVRSYDNKDRWIISIDLPSGKITTLEHQHDEAWIGGPGISGWNMVTGTLGWLSDNETIYFQSEETGYSHLYTYNTSTGEKEAITSGQWEVHSVELSKNGSIFYIHANKTHPGNRNFYHLHLNTKKLIPILEGDGNYQVTVSPNEKDLAIRYSYKNKPWELYLAINKQNTKITQITSSTSKSFNNYNWYNPEVIKIESRDSNTLYARVYIPDDSKKNNAAIIFVHGAGYLQNAHNYWSDYYREYMFHNLLRDNGFTILDIDYRASKGYGRDHRTAIYREMGGVDLTDQIDGKRFLIDSLKIDSNRVGIYGGSYGGFITLMALLKTPGEFKAGAALRSVTDWFHYNHEYTSNILNYPTTDPEAYKKSSPIYYAENLKDRLLMLHGMVDDNVQFQDIIRLTQRFIELEKNNWELAVFPVEGHGFKKSSSWNDEYRRIYELFYEELILEKNGN